jgi:riboflavin kinase/FMN adenylyltransferase
VILLSNWAKKRGVQAILVPPEKHGDKVISSSWIRSCILEGDMEKSCLLLGRPIAYEGTVLSGRKLGRSLGFPTANIGIPFGKIVPQYGVYASFLLHESRLIPSVSNIGVRPTVEEPDVHPMIETTMHHVDLDLYGKIVKVFPVRKIREERKFSGLDALQAQVGKDLIDSIRIHAEIDFDYSKLIPGVVL